MCYCVELPGLKTMEEISAKYSTVKDNGNDEDDDDDDDDDDDEGPPPQPPPMVERPPRGFGQMPVCTLQLKMCSTIITVAGMNLCQVFLLLVAVTIRK